MTTEDTNSKSLGKLEDMLWRARHIARENNDVEMYGRLDNAFLLTQYLSMGLILERDKRNSQ